VADGSRQHGQEDEEVHGVRPLPVGWR
jgi:hypothetical protein